MKCPDCGAEMIRLIAMKRQYGESTYVCPNIRYNTLDIKNRAVLLSCKPRRRILKASESSNGKCPDCKKEMIQMMEFKREIDKTFIYICHNIKYHKIDLDKRAVLITCKPKLSDSSVTKTRRIWNLNAEICSFNLRLWLISISFGWVLYVCKRRVEKFEKNPCW